MSVTAIHLLYKEKFEPIVRIGENVRLIVQEDDIFGRVVYIEPIQPFIINLGDLPAAKPSSWPARGGEVMLEDLQLGDKEFGQWRMTLLDDFMLEVKMPAAVLRFLRRRGSTYISRLTPSNILEFYTYSDSVPTVTPLNPNFRQLEMARLAVVGFRYVLEELSSEPKEYTIIPIDGKPVTVRR